MPNDKNMRNDKAEAQDQVAAKPQLEPAIPDSSEPAISDRPVPEPSDPDRNATSIANPLNLDAANNLDTTTAQFEQALSQQEQRHYHFRLYIAGTTPHSMRSLENLKALCETYLPGRYELEVIDIYQSGTNLQIDNIVAIPTLVKQLPLPIRRVIGDLSNTEKVLLGLDLIAK